MAKITCTFISVEGDEAVVRAAIESFTASFGGGQAPVMLAPATPAISAPPAPAVHQRITAPVTRVATKQAPKVEAPVKPAPASKPRVTRVAASTNPDAADPEPQGEAGCRGKVEALLKRGDASSAELIAACKPYSSASVYLALKALRQAGSVKSEVIDGESKSVWVGK